MNIEEYKEKALSYAEYPDKGNNVLYAVATLNEEAGEVAGKIRKMYRDSNGIMTPEIRHNILMECGDVFWALFVLVYEELQSDMDTITDMTIFKLAGRKARGTIGGSGDDR